MYTLKKNKKTVLITILLIWSSTITDNSYREHQYLQYQTHHDNH